MANLRGLAAALTPPIAGLRARNWRDERGMLCGRYLFDDAAALATFVDDPEAWDPPARACIPGFAELPSTVEQLIDARAEDLFDRPIFIISAPRAGSTLLYELLSKSSELWTIDGESHGVIEGIRRLHPAAHNFDSHALGACDLNADTALSLKAGFIAELRSADGLRYLEVPQRSRPRSLRFLEKTPENALRVPFLAAAFPDARFVFLYRDARPNVSSLVEGWEHGAVNIPNLSGWERGPWCFLLPDGWRDLRDRSLSDIAAFQWRAANEIAIRDLSALPRERWTSLDYEDLVATPEQVLRRLAEYLEIQFEGSLESASTRPLKLSVSTISPPSPDKWRSNASFREESLARLGIINGRPRNFDATALPTKAEESWRR